MVIYTDKLIPKNSAGLTLGPVILIRPAYKNDVGLLEHEKVHVKQWKRTLGLFWILYAIPKFRLKYEVDAYKVQLRYSPRDVDLFAKYLVENYSLNITFNEAKQMLTK